MGGISSASSAEDVADLNTHIATVSAASADMQSHVAAILADQDALTQTMYSEMIANATIVVDLQADIADVGAKYKTQLLTSISLGIMLNMLIVIMLAMKLIMRQ